MPTNVLVTNSFAASDHSPPVPALIPVFGDLNAGLSITTPGGTRGSDGLADGMTVSNFDTTDDGPQSNFHWASITLLPDSQGSASATLDATFQTAAAPTPLFDDVTVQMTVGVPEPASFSLLSTALLAGLRLIRRRRV